MTTRAPPGVLVCARKAPLQTLLSGPSSTSCSADIGGSPLVGALTKFDGTLSPPNVAVGKNRGDGIPIVVQVGRWRGEVSS